MTVELKKWPANTVLEVVIRDPSGTIGTYVPSSGFGRVPFPAELTTTASGGEIEFYQAVHVGSPSGAWTVEVSVKGQPSTTVSRGFTVS